MNGSYISHVALVRRRLFQENPMKRIASVLVEDHSALAEKDHLWWKSKCNKQRISRRKSKGNTRGRWPSMQVTTQSVKAIMTSHHKNLTRTTWRIQAGEWFHSGVCIIIKTRFSFAWSPRVYSNAKTTICSTPKQLLTGAGRLQVEEIHKQSTAREKQFLQVWLW